MASRLPWALLAVALLTAGCATPRTVDNDPDSESSIPDGMQPIPTDTAASTPTSTGPPPCPAPGEALAAFTAAEAMMADDGLPGGTWSLRMEGQMEGEIGSMTVSSDPARKALFMVASFGGEGVDARFVHPHFSMAAGGEGFQGRDHDPAADGQSFIEDAGSDGTEELGVDFGDDLGLDDFTVTCAEQDGTPTLEFRHADEDSLQTVVVERQAPHRLLGGRDRDNVTRDDLRFSFSYDPPNIQVDTTLPRAPLEVGLRVLAQHDTGEGVLTRVRLAEDSQWAPMSEFDVAVVGAEESDLGQPYNRYRLQEGTFAMDEGTFTFEDLDGNDLLSAGDVLEVTVLYGYDFQIYDNWAAGYVAWTPA